MGKISLEANKNYCNEDSSLVTIKSICVDILSTGEIETVLVVYLEGELYWLRLPVANETIKTWRRA